MIALENYLERRGNGFPTIPTIINSQKIGGDTVIASSHKAGREDLTNPPIFHELNNLIKILQKVR